MAQVTPHVYPILQNVNFDSVNHTWHANCVFFELKEKEKATRVFLELKK